MRHTALMTSIVLTVLSGFVLSQLWAMEPVSPLAIPAATTPQVEEIATTFYSAVNAYLEEGDDRAVRSLLHPKFATHQTGSTWAGNTEDFLRHLESVRLIYPGIQLEPEPVAIGNNTASVTLSVSNQQEAEFAGVGVDPVSLFGQLDLVRIERGLIIERWSSAPMAGQLEAYPTLSIDLPYAIDTLVARVQHIPLEDVSEPMINVVRQMLLIVTSGEAFLDVTDQPAVPAISAMLWRVNHGHAAAAAPLEPEITVALHPMEAVYLPAGTTFRMWDSRNRNAAVLALEFGPTTSSEQSGTAPVFGPLRGTLWNGIELEDVGDRLTLSFGRATLLPESALSSQDLQGMALAWVTSGSLEMAGSGGEARMRSERGTRAQLIDGQAMLQAGEAAAAGPEADIRFQNSGDTPATAWVFSLVPASDPENRDGAIATPAGPSPTPTRNPTLS